MAELLVRIPVARPAGSFNSAGAAARIIGMALLVLAFTAAVLVILKKEKTELGDPNLPAALIFYASVCSAMLLRFGLSLTAAKGMILAAILLYASLSDIAKREVPDFVTVMILISAFIGFETAKLPSMILGAAAVFVPQVLVSVLRPKRAIGGADIKISSALAFMLGIEKGLFALITGLLTGIIAMLIVRKIRKKTNAEPFALVPFLSFGAMAAYIF